MVRPSQVLRLTINDPLAQNFSYEISYYNYYIVSPSEPLTAMLLKLVLYTGKLRNEASMQRGGYVSCVPVECPPTPRHPSRAT